VLPPPGALARRCRAFKCTLFGEAALRESHPNTLSPPPLLRFQVVKKIWEYIKLRDLQNPVNKSEIHCDGDLKAVMGGEATVTAFSLNKYIGAHLTKVEKAS